MLSESNGQGIDSFSPADSFQLAIEVPGWIVGSAIPVVFHILIVFLLENVGDRGPSEGLQAVECIAQ
jgi:hypothetical protein